MLQVLKFFSSIYHLIQFFQVIVSVDMGEGYGTFNATAPLRDGTNICDGQWHVVDVVFVKNVVTIRVDDGASQGGHSREGKLQELRTNGPLYIGGFPGTFHVVTVVKV